MQGEGPQLHVRAISGPDRVRIVVGGELDLDSLEQLVHEVERQIGATPAVVELDLREVTFIDAAGLGALVRCRQAATGNGGRLQVAAASPIVARTMRLAGLAEAFDLGD